MIITVIKTAKDQPYMAMNMDTEQPNAIEHIYKELSKESGEWGFAHRGAVIEQEISTFEDFKNSVFRHINDIEKIDKQIDKSRAERSGYVTNINENTA